MNTNELQFALLKKITESDIAPVAIHSDDPLTFIIYPITQVGNTSGYVVKRITSGLVTTVIENGFLPESNSFDVKVYDAGLTTALSAIDFG
jgi:hypothetical protein